LKPCQEASADIVGKPDAANNAVDSVPVTKRIVKAFKRQHAGAFSHHQSVGLVIEGRTPPRGGDGPKLGEADLGVKTFGTGHTSRQHDVGAMCPQFVTGELDGKKRGRTGGIEGEGAATKTESPGKK
jgi:hypothetical protein